MGTCESHKPFFERAMDKVMGKLHVIGGTGFIGYTHRGGAGGGGGWEGRIIPQ